MSLLDVCQLCHLLSRLHIVSVAILATGLMRAVRLNHTVNLWAVKPKRCPETNHFLNMCFTFTTNANIIKLKVYTIQPLIELRAPPAPAATHFGLVATLKYCYEVTFLGGGWPTTPIHDKHDVYQCKPHHFLPLINQ